MKKLTREERRRRSQRRQLITYLLFLLLLLAWLLSYTVMTVEAEPGAAEAQETAVPAVYLGEPQDGRLPGDDTPATERCYLTEDEIEAAENEMIEAALLANATRLDDVTVTHYCTCSTCCGKSDGITASGLRATPGGDVPVRGGPGDHCGDGPPDSRADQPGRPGGRGRAGAETHQKRIRGGSPC